jgi:hypothetical protein
VAEPFTSNPLQDWIVPAELEYIGVPLVNRTTPYTGPGVEELPNLITE